jgi:hypothetical protein
MAAMPHLDAVVSLSRFVIAWFSGLLNSIVKGLLRPAFTSILIGSVVDLSRSKADLIAENALLLCWTRFDKILLAKSAIRDEDIKTGYECLWPPH